MLPIVFEWRWDIGHIIFMGLFYSALTIIILTLIIAFKRTLKDFNLNKHFRDNERKH